MSDSMSLYSFKINLEILNLFSKILRSYDCTRNLKVEGWKILEGRVFGSEVLQLNLKLHSTYGLRF